MSRRNERVEVVLAVWTRKHITAPELIAVQRAAMAAAEEQGLKVISCGVGFTDITEDHRDLIERVAMPLPADRSE